MKKLLFIFIWIVACNSNLSAQTTVISHGYAALISDPINGWMLDMANGICNRAGGGVVRIYNKATGNFDYLSGSGNRTVLLFDWWDDSNDLHEGFSEAAGAALFAALMNGKNHNDFNLNQLHFIGHSRGCIVNSEAIERLLVAGIPVEQATSIDAHDWGGAGITVTDYDVNPDSIYSGVEGWAGITWADSYWQDALFSTNGRAVEGTYSVYMGTISHDGIHDWYLQTILDTSMHEGYYYSLVGGGSAQRPPRTGVQRNPFFTFENDGIVNGNFDRGGVIYESIGGWWYHGGGGDADIDNTYLALHSGGSYKIHDRFYVPVNATSIDFDYQINETDDSGVPPNIDKMLVLINDSVVLDNMWMESEMTSWGHVSIDVSALCNTVNTMEFRLIDEYSGSDELNSEIWIDNIRFELLSVNTQNIANTQNSILIYPNPAAEYINMDNVNVMANSYCIYNQFGQLVGAAQNVPGDNIVFVGNLSSGMYVLVLETPDGTQKQKFIVQK